MDPLLKQFGWSNSSWKPEQRSTCFWFVYNFLEAFSLTKTAILHNLFVRTGLHKILAVYLKKKDLLIDLVPEQNLWEI